MTANQPTSRSKAARPAKVSIISVNRRFEPDTEAQLRALLTLLKSSSASPTVEYDLTGLAQTPADKIANNDGK